MRESYSKCNHDLIKSSVIKNFRIDGRHNDQYRPLNVSFGQDYGCCMVSLGNTKVLAQVSTSIAEPRLSRPSEGLIEIRVDLSPMASPSFEFGRSSDEHVELSRLLHRGIKDARCIDLESLCLVSGEKVWRIQVDLIMLNDEGNIIEVASIAALSALAHHRRPEVTIENGEVIIHPFEQRHPLRFTILHKPFLVKYVFFEGGVISLVDPNEDEERVCEGYLIVAANTYREITLLHISGKSRVSKERILARCNSALWRTKIIDELVKKALEEDEKARAQASEARIPFTGSIFHALSSVYPSHYSG